MARTRTAIRATVGCPSCSAQVGEHCRAYVRGEIGNPTGDVHAARWEAWREWLRARSSVIAASSRLPSASTSAAALVQQMPVQRGEPPRVLPDVNDRIAASAAYIRSAMTGPLCGAWLTRLTGSDPGSSASTADAAADAVKCSSPVS